MEAQPQRYYRLHGKAEPYRSVRRLSRRTLIITPSLIHSRSAFFYFRFAIY